MERSQFLGTGVRRDDMDKIITMIVFLPFGINHTVFLTALTVMEWDRTLEYGHTDGIMVRLKKAFHDQN
jgi:hypothetical protein